MSKVNLSVVAIQEHKAVPPIARKARRKFPFLAGAVVLIALAAIGVAMRASKTQPIQQPSNKAAEMTVTVIHPQKASIMIPVLPGQTEAYTDAPIFAQTSGYLKKWYFDIGPRSKRVMFLPRSTLPKSINSWHKRRLNSRWRRPR
jgi:hypothetical protein